MQKNAIVFENIDLEKTKRYRGGSPKPGLTRLVLAPVRLQRGQVLGPIIT